MATWERLAHLIALASVATFVALAQQPKAILRLDGSNIVPAEVDATVKRLMNAAEVPGACIVIFNHGKPI
jgi:hypothetical protein